MDPELKQHLEAIKNGMEAMESRLLSRIDATENRMEGMETHMEAMETRLRSHFEARIEKTETNLLSAFHGWARGMEIRVRGVSGMATGFDERLALAEEPSPN